MEGLIDKRLNQVSHRRAPVDEVMRLVDCYWRSHEGWNARHFYRWYQRDGGKRSYTWVKTRQQEAKLVPKAAKRGAHRKRRERSPLPGLLLHQDGSTHEWVPGQHWDLIVTMDDATNEHYSMFFVEEEGTQSSFRGVREVIEAHGLFSALYTDRGSHYWTTPEAGGKVDKVNLTQFGRAMKHLGIDRIAAYSPEARGRSERAFLRRTRAACPRSWHWPASRTWIAPTVICGMCMVRRSMPNLPTRRWKKEPHLCLFWAAIWMTFCANSSSARWAKTIACSLRA